MEKRVFFENARENVLEFFTQEFSSLSIEKIDTLVGLFYKLANYEEEGQKIKPIILFTNNINSAIRSVPNVKKIVFYEDNNMLNFKQRLKALMCFCKYDWSIYVNFDENKIEYGIVNSLTSIKEKTLVQYLTQESVLENLGKKLNLVILNIIGSGVCKLIGAKGNICSVHFNLSSESEYHWDKEAEEFVNACVSKIKTTHAKLNDIKTLITNIFHRVLRDLHGAICVVVDKDYQDTNGFLSDGTWLKEPIEFGKLILRSKTFDENILRGFSDVLTTMLNYDGITVLDNAGRIRAYNVFIESNAKGAVLLGGARRRAAYTILQNKSPKIIGVYFQSQEGDNFYKEKGDIKKKKKFKIVNGEVVNKPQDEMLPLDVLAKLQQQKHQEEKEHKVENQDAKKENSEIKIEIKNKEDANVKEIVTVNKEKITETKSVKD